jgi:integration host factor subunit alpha
MTLTKADLAENVYQGMQIKKIQARQIVDDLFEVIRTHLEQGETVKVTRFGKFELSDKNSRPGRNPKTGEEVAISPRRIATFKVSQKLKELVELLPTEEIEKDLA